MKLSPALHPLIADLLNQRELLFEIMSHHAGPVHLQVPEIMDENVESFAAVAKQLGIEITIHYAQKASRSTCFVKRAKKNGIHIDVASAGELRTALDNGFKGSEISCTGPKDDNFLQLAINEKCQIAVDSLEELQRLSDLLYACCAPRQIDVLIRINSIAPRSRKLKRKPSRFGISLELIDTAYLLLQKCRLLRLRGFQFHHDGYDSTARGEFLEQLFELMLDAYKRGFNPDIIDIGGSFRNPLLENPLRWQIFVESLCEKLHDGKRLPGWGNEPFGLSLNGNGSVLGREKLLSQSTIETAASYLHNALSYTTNNRLTPAQRIGDALFTVMIEPGFALIYNAGISIVRVIEVKNNSDESFVITNGNMFSIGSKMFEPLADPIHLSRQKTELRPFSGYIVGNLCREDDFLMKRKIEFSNQPQPGDLLVFANTAAYSADFEETHSIQQPVGIKLACIKEFNNWKVLPESEYAV